MPHFLVTTRLSEPLEAPDAAAAEAMAEAMDFGLVTVIEVELVDGAWRPTGQLRNLADTPRTIMVPITYDEFKPLLDLMTGWTDRAVDFDALVNSEPVTLRFMRKQL